MRLRKLKLIAALLLACAFAFAVLPPTTVWEVRPTIGSDADNGGCYDSAKAGGSSVDYSQQNFTQYNGTDLVIVTSTTVSAVSHSFVAFDVGNCIHITAGTGFTAGFYEIESVSGGVATLDRSPGSTSSTGGTYWVGGALATVATVNSNATQANITWIKASGTYTVTTAVTITLNSSTSGTCAVTTCPGNPYSFIGYTSTRGDGGQITWTTSTNSINLVALNEAQNVLFQNIIFSSTAGSPGDGIDSTNASVNSQAIYVINCEFTGFSIGIEGNFSVDTAEVGLFIGETRITANTSHGVRNSGSTLIIGSQFDNNGGDGAQFQAGSIADNSSWSVKFSVFYKNGGNGINLNFGNSGGSTLPIIALDNVDSSTNTGAGVLNSNDVINPTIRINNSIFDANGTYGLDAGSGTTIVNWLGFNNAFYNNTTAATRNIAAGIGTITLTASPYKTLGSNFALNSTSGGGAALLNAGFPGTIPGAGTGFISVGALQPQSSSGGGQKAFAIIQ
jgi:hypothetical protein